ncbi:7-cyano-7-deazaguanine synthase [Candidatus Omnitrophota bacterium]
MKAVALFSGGLDSSVAAKLILDQGIEVAAVNFTSSVFTKKDSSAAIRKSAQEIGIDVEIFDITEEFLQVVKSPEHGRGSNLNPCIDCKIFMLRRAKKYMQEIGASFVITGEVLGQRPMSQHRQALEIIERKSGLEGLLVRPLSAKLLPETIPEKNGWINREKLLSLNGRTRSQQLKLADEFGIDGYSTPSGGCLLTYEGYSKKLKDLMTHSQLQLHDLQLLKLGRHFRLTPTIKLIVGKDEKENNALLQAAQQGDVVFEPTTIPGPTAIARGEGIGQEGNLQLACSIVARYCDSDNGDAISMNYYQIPQKEISHFSCVPLEEERFKTHKINQ